MLKLILERTAALLQRQRVHEPRLLRRSLEDGHASLRHGGGVGQEPGGLLLGQELRELGLLLRGTGHAREAGERVLLGPRAGREGSRVELSVRQSRTGEGLGTVDTE